MGVFQITGQNSNEDYSWGELLTPVQKKKPSITMKLVYDIVKFESKTHIHIALLFNILIRTFTQDLS